MSNKDDKLITKGQVADILGVSNRTVERLVATGDFLRVKIGGTVRFRRSHVLKVLESGC